MAEKLNRIEAAAIALTRRVAQSLRAGAPATEILDDVGLLYVLVEEVEALQTAREPDQDASV